MNSLLVWSALTALSDGLHFQFREGSQEKLQGGNWVLLWRNVSSLVKHKKYIYFTHILNLKE